MSSAEKKKKTRREKQSRELPYDLLVSCLARVPRLYYPKLSLVSKSFGSLIASPDLHQTRSDLGRTDTCIYVCLQFTPDSNPRWYTLCQKPDKTLSNHIITKSKKNKEKEESSGYVLAAIPTPHSPMSNRSALVSVGSNIYNIGGYTGWTSSSDVWVLDCKTHTWDQVPNMRGKRFFPSASVIDGKIYVGGGCEYDDDELSGAFRSIEVFDPSTQTWDLVSSPTNILGPNLRTGLNWRLLSRSANIEGTFHLMLGDKCLSYEPKKGKWNFIGPASNIGNYWNRASHCVIGNVLYSYVEKVFVWYNTKMKLWEKLKGLKGLPKIPKNSGVKLVDYSGKMAILWDKVVLSSGSKEKRIWCAVITLENSNGTGIWGKVEWCDGVLTVPKSYVLDHALSVTF